MGYVPLTAIHYLYLYLTSGVSVGYRQGIDKQEHYRCYVVENSRVLLSQLYLCWCWNFYSLLTSCVGNVITYQWHRFDREDTENKARYISSKLEYL